MPARSILHHRQEASGPNGWRPVQSRFQDKGGVICNNNDFIYWLTALHGLSQLHILDQVKRVVFRTTAGGAISPHLTRQVQVGPYPYIYYSHFGTLELYQAAISDF